MNFLLRKGSLVEFFCFVFAHQARAVLPSLGGAGFGAGLRFARVALGFAEALDETDRSAGEIPFGAELIFEEAFVAEMERIFLIGEEQERRRSGFRLHDVIDFDGARFRSRAALEIDFLFDPAIEFGRGDAHAARSGDLIDQRIEFAGAIAGFRGEKNDRGVAQEFEFVADELFVIKEQAAFVLIAEAVDALCCARVRMCPRIAFVRTIFAVFRTICAGARFACFEFRAGLGRCAVFRDGFGASIMGVAPGLAFACCGGAFGGFAGGFDGEIPFVHHDDDTATGLLGVVGDLRVALGDALFAIDDEERDVSAFETAAGHHDAELFGDERGLAFAADAGGVDEIVEMAVVLDFGVDGIHRGTGNGRDDGAFLADEAIQKRRFADVGAADDGDLHGAIRIVVGGFAGEFVFGFGVFGVDVGIARVRGHRKSRNGNGVPCSRGLLR